MNQPLTREEFRAQMQEKEQAAFSLLKNQTDKVMHDQDAFKTLLDMLATHVATSVGNTILVQAQYPNATAVNSIAEWEKRKVPVLRNEDGYYPAGIYQFATDGQYVDPQTNEIRTKYKVFKGYDASQTVNPEYAQAIMNDLAPIKIFVGTQTPEQARNLALCASSPVRCMVYDPKKLIHDAENISEKDELRYIPETKTVIIRKVARQEWFQRVAYEIALGVFHKRDGADFNRKARSFEAGIVSYLLCRHAGVDTSAFRFNLNAVPQKYPNQREFRAMLGSCQEIAHELAFRLNNRLREQNQKSQPATACRC